MKSLAVMILSASALVTLGAAVWYITAGSAFTNGSTSVAITRPSQRIGAANQTSERHSHSRNSLSEEERAHNLSVLSSAYTDSGYGRKKRVLEFLEAITEDNWPEMLEIAESAWRRGFISPEEKDWCSKRAGEVGGSRAVEATLNLQTGDGNMAVLSGWAKGDPYGALEYIAAMPSGRTRNVMTLGYVGGAAIADMNLALRAMGELPTHYQSGVAAELARSPDVRGYEPLLRKWLEGNGEVPIGEKSGVLNQLMLRCAI